MALDFDAPRTELARMALRQRAAETTRRIAPAMSSVPVVTSTPRRGGAEQRRLQRVGAEVGAGGGEQDERAGDVR